MAQVATAMGRKKERAEDAEFCTYASVKIDDRLIHLAKAAASLEELPLQEFLSNIVNEVVSQKLSREPVKRRPAPPRK